MRKETHSSLIADEMFYVTGEMREAPAAVFAGRLLGDAFSRW
jgi:hypothetical protein